MNSTTASDQAAAAVEIAAYISELDFNVMQSYCTTSAIALLAYHCITTLDDDVTHLWGKAVAQKGRITLAWILFFGNRYLPLVVYAYQAAWWPASTDITGCAATIISQYILEYSQYGLWTAIASLRAYAVSRKKLLAVLVFLLGLIPIFCSISVFAKYVTPKIGPVNGCTPDTSRLPFEVYEISGVFGYSSWILSEVLVVAVTLSATYDYTALAGTTGRGRRSLSAVLFQDGLGIFVKALLLSIAQLIVHLFALLRPAAWNISAAAVLTLVAPLTSILFTRLYFDLQQTAVVTSLDINTNISIGVEHVSRSVNLDIQFAQYSNPDEDEEPLRHDMAGMHA